MASNTPARTFAAPIVRDRKRSAEAKRATIARRNARTAKRLAVGGTR
jgi:hypothetical protein